MNRYTDDGTAIIDASGREWPVNEWRKMPIPIGINFGNVVFGGIEEAEPPSHWLTHAKTPSIPVNNHNDLDEEALGDACEERYGKGDRAPTEQALHFWNAALKHARKEAK